MTFGPYPITVTRVVDGDTLVVDIDCGFHVVLWAQYVRLTGINTPEVRGPSREEGLRAKAMVETFLADAGPLVLISDHYDEREKYGRILGRIIARETGDSLNDFLADQGWASPTRGFNRDGERLPRLGG